MQFNSLSVNGKIQIFVAPNASHPWDKAPVLNPIGDFNKLTDFHAHGLWACAGAPPFMQASWGVDIPLVLRLPCLKDVSKKKVHQNQCKEMPVLVNFPLGLIFCCLKLWIV